MNKTSRDCDGHGTFFMRLCKIVIVFPLVCLGCGLWCIRIVDTVYKGLPTR